MRLWSVHPKYLDSKGLVALWREGLLAKKVLEGKTRGYRKHPQLIRFLRHEKPVWAINNYLHNVLQEAESRGYKFDGTKLEPLETSSLIEVTDGQLTYEFEHLMNKLSARDPARFDALQDIQHPDPHPLFKVIHGNVEAWEKL